MKLKNNEFINEKFIDAIIGMEETPNSGKITDFSILFDMELIPVEFERINLKLFCGVPGYRLNKTILEKSELSLKYKDETLYFEYEKGLKYYLNINNIIRIESFNNIWKIQMVEDEYWFVADPSNFKKYFLDNIAD